MESKTYQRVKYFLNEQGIFYWLKSKKWNSQWSILRARKLFT